MKDVAAAKAKKTNQKTRNDRNPFEENTALHCRYGQIGIAAVAAAIRYQGSIKNTAYAPAVIDWREPVVT